MKEFEAIQLNAANGSPWQCSQGQIGMAAGTLSKLIRQVAKNELGLSASNDWLRDKFRIPFYRMLFADADYNVFQRTALICSTGDLTSGEASALIKFVRSEGAYGALGTWMSEQAESVGIPHSTGFSQIWDL